MAPYTMGVGSSACWTNLKVLTKKNGRFNLKLCLEVFLSESDVVVRIGHIEWYGESKSRKD